MKATSLFLLSLFTLIITVNTNAQTTCAAAATAVTGTNSATAQSELWYKFSVDGKPLARYYIDYDSKTLSNLSVEVLAGTCGNLSGQGSSIPAIAGDTRTYYIHFTWNSGTPQAFSWELSQSLVVPMTDINVTPKTYSPVIGGSFNINSRFTVNTVPSNATTSYFTEYAILDYEGGILQADNSGVVINGNCVVSGNTPLSVIGTGTAKILFNALVFENNIPVSVGSDTVTITVAAPALCSLATGVNTGANSAPAVSEQWFRFTAAKTGVHTIHVEDIDGDGKGDLATNWTVYEGLCDNLRFIQSNGGQFPAEAGKTYSIKLNQTDIYQYGLQTFNWTLEAPKSLTGFSLTTKTLELEMNNSYGLHNLGINFTPADATDKGVSVTVRDTSLIDFWEDGPPHIYKDNITTRNREGSTYLVFTTHDGGFKDSCLVTVKYVHLTSFALTYHEKTLWLPYGTDGEYVNVNDTSALRIVCAPENATDKSYTVSVRKKGIVNCYSDGRWNNSLTAQHEGSTYVVFTANDGGLQDSILINVTRKTTGGSPCESAAVAQLGVNDMPAAENHTKWFIFTPTESGNYGLTNHVTKYPQTFFEVYEGQCDNLYLFADGDAQNVSSSVNYNGDYNVGFNGAAGISYYLKLTTGDYNTVGGSDIYAYKWSIAKISASISGTVTDNGLPVQGRVELYSIPGNNPAILTQTADIQTNGAYQFDDLGVGNYAVRAVTSDGNITWYGSNTPYYVESAKIFSSKSEAITGKDISIVRKETLNEGTAKISGYIVRSEDVVPKSAPSIRRVRSATGNPIAGISVFLRRSNESTPITYTQTDSEGYFEFMGVGVGEYQVVVQIVGIESEATGVTITGDGETVEFAYEVSQTAIENTTAGNYELKITNYELQVYPNPVQDELFIRSEDAINNVQIFDVSGRTVRALRATPLQTNGVQTINVSRLPRGVYFVKIGNQTAKFVKK